MLRLKHSIGYELTRRLRFNYDSGQSGGLENRLETLPAVTILVMVSELFKPLYWHSICDKAFKSFLKRLHFSLPLENWYASLKTKSDTLYHPPKIVSSVSVSINIISSKNLEII